MEAPKLGNFVYKFDTLTNLLTKYIVTNVLKFTKGPNRGKIEYFYISPIVKIEGLVAWYEKKETKLSIAMGICNDGEECPKWKKLGKEFSEYYIIYTPASVLAAVYNAKNKIIE